MRLLTLRGEEPPDDAVVVVRAGANGLSDETLRRTATAAHDEFGFYGVSVFLALDASVTELYASNDYLRRYSMIRSRSRRRVGSEGWGSRCSPPRLASTSTSLFRASTRRCCSA